ncbi:MAG TPA: aldo/keto reductase [Armatimonadetes bacterium]|nr:aldo/keto reductase [Armatimonadota bacterium]
MQYRRLGKTDLQVSVIGFGAIKLPGISAEEASAALNRALDLGINFVDTARNYRDSEEKIGRALSGRREEFYLATKTGKRDAEGVRADLETSLRELRTEVIDLYQLHSVSSPGEWEKVMAPGGALEAVVKAKEEGKIRHIGISIHRALNVMREAITCDEFETVMLAYSPLDQEGVAAEILPLAKKHDLGVIVMKPLSGGLLATPQPEGKPRRPGPDPLVVGSLHYIISNPNVSVVIPGMQSVREVEENAPVGDRPEPMTAEERAELFRALGSLGREFRYGQVCLRCGYCQPCSQGIPIPEVFRAVDMYRSYPEELKGLAVEVYRKLEVKPTECVECEECIPKCPAGLEIPTRLKEAVELFTPLM